jgi:hypothetical protein
MPWLPAVCIVKMEVVKIEVMALTLRFLSLGLSLGLS